MHGRYKDKNQTYLNQAALATVILRKVGKILETATPEGTEEILEHKEVIKQIITTGNQHPPLEVSPQFFYKLSTYSSPTFCNSLNSQS